MTAATPTAPPFRIGLLLDSADVSKPVYEFVQWAQSQERLQITHLILLPPKQDAGIQSTISKFVFKAVVALERLLLARNKHYRDHLRAFDLSALLPNTIRLRPFVAPTGSVRNDSDDDASLVRELELDLLITFTAGALAGDILTAARLGVLSVCYGDDQEERGGPAGFWEVYFREDTTGFSFQRLVGKENAGAEALFRGFVGTQYYYLLNKAALCEKSIYYLKKFVEKLAAAGKASRRASGRFAF